MEKAVLSDLTFLNWHVFLVSSMSRYYTPGRIIREGRTNRAGRTKPFEDFKPAVLLE